MSSIRNIYFEKPIVNRMTQGSIINGCVADAFPGEEVFGLIITPRCDVSHEGKVDSVHYLPVVPFERWFEIIAKPKIKDIWKKSLLNKLDSKFKNAKVGAPGFFRGTPLRPSIATHRTGKTTALIQRFCILCKRRKSDLTLHAALT